MDRSEGRVPAAQHAPLARGDARASRRTVAGIGLMVLAILLFTVMDTLGKDLTARYPELADDDTAWRDAHRKRS